MRRFFCLAAILLVAGCDRPVVDLAPPRVEVVFPTDLSVVQTSPILELALRAEVFGEIDSVAVGGRAMDFNGSRSTYEASVSLFFGLNVLPVEVFDAEGLRGTDTLHVFHADLRSASSAVSGSPVAVRGAAASSLPTGNAFVSGGASRTGGGRSDGTLITARSSVLAFTSVDLLGPRTDHSSTVLPDGRVLLIGGAQAVSPASFEINPTAEIVDLAEGTSSAVPIRTDPAQAGGGVAATIRRSNHTARLLTVDGVSVLYLYGGVDASGTPSSTVDVLRWDDGALTRLSPPGGASGGFPVFPSPTEVAIGNQGVSEGSSVVFGLATGEDERSAFSFDWLPRSQALYPFDLVARTITPLQTPRTETAALFTEGFVLVVGGTAADGTTLDTFEAYVPSADRTFRFPDAVRLRIPRSDHTATLLPGGRILIVGGRDASDNALFSPEAFQF